MATLDATISPESMPNSISILTALFESLDDPTEIPVGQKFEGILLGPSWFKLMNSPLLKVGALAGWKGKWFECEGRTLNIVARRTGDEFVVPMDTSIREYSRGSGKVIALDYPGDSPFPWNYILDEIRPLGNGDYLGTTTFRAPFARRIPIPFMLKHIGTSY